MYAARISDRDTVERLLALYWKMHKAGKSCAMLKTEFTFDSVHIPHGKVSLETYFQFNNMNSLINGSAKHKNVEEASRLLLASLAVCNFSECADSVMLNDKMGENPMKLLDILDVISDNKAFKCYPNLGLELSLKNRPELRRSDKYTGWFNIHEFNRFGPIMAAFVENAILASFEASKEGTVELSYRDQNYFRLREELPTMIDKFPQMLTELKLIVKKNVQQQGDWMHECHGYASMPVSKLKYLSREQRMFSLVYQNHYNPEFNGYCQQENLFAQFCTIIDSADHEPLLLMSLNPQFQCFGNIVNFVLHTSLNDWALALNNIKIEQLNKSFDSDDSAEKKKKKRKKKPKKKKKDEKIEAGDPSPTGAQLVVKAEAMEEAAQVSAPKSSQNLKAGESTADIKTNCVTSTQEEQKAKSRSCLQGEQGSRQPSSPEGAREGQLQVSDSVQESSLKAKESKKDTTHGHNKYLAEKTNAALAKEDEAVSISMNSHFGIQDRNYCNSVGESEFARDQINKPIRIPTQDKHLRKQSFGHEDSAFKSNEFEKEKASKTERFLSTDLKMKTKNFTIVELSTEPKLKAEKKLSADFKNPLDPLGLLQSPTIPVAVSSAKGCAHTSEEESSATTPPNPKSVPGTIAEKAPPTPVFGLVPAPNIPDMPLLSHSTSTPVPKAIASPTTAKKPTLKKVVPGSKKNEKSGMRLKLKKSDRYEDDKGASDYKRKPVGSSSNTGGWISAGSKYEKEKTPASLSNYSGYTKKTEDKPVNAGQEKTLSNKSSPQKPKSTKSVPFQADEPAPERRSLLEKFNSKVDSVSSRSGYSEMKAFTPTGEKSPGQLDREREAGKYLNTELLRLINDTKAYASATEIRRQLARERIELVMKETFNAADNKIELKTYGSSESGLVIPYSDIDLLISMPSGQLSRDMASKMLEFLHDNLKDCGWVSNLQLIREATVPILKVDVDVASSIDLSMFNSMYLSEPLKARLNKLVTDQTGHRPNIQKVDLIIETKDISAIQTTEFQKQAIVDYPDMFNLAMLLKYYLTSQNLNKPYLGKLA